ncbi:MAG: bifunctional chorismate mutase/prephenate dehydratase [Lentisphaerae bacterium]|jgi:chorismate mutase/prephenate dehydratase|nr:bifunctional chorismate mutase/prephenate dehydratase [Lentisphaerota bacterium]
MSADLEKCRSEIDAIDSELVELVKRRMRVVADVAAAKKAAGAPVLDATRERQLLAKVSALAGAEFETMMRGVFSMLMDVSRSYQHRLAGLASPLTGEITEALAATPPLFPPRAVVSCQGTEGAYSQMACDKLFASPEIMYTSSFEGVFQAVASGMCEYGVVPIENSLAGSVTQVYDLLRRYDVKIVRSLRLQISHALLARPGTTLAQVREILSHEQALLQCAPYLNTLKGVKATACDNTAVAARRVAESDRSDLAAIASKACAEHYGLEILADGVQGNDGNYTRFICLSRRLEIYPGANRTSMLMELPNRPGALYRVLVRFYALGINMVKLESRPLPGSTFDFMFYVEVDAPVYAPAFMQLMAELDTELAQFRYLGSYLEGV